jgi:serine-type D-Ala-D-Ala endopeptidase (penicillin-binding protein 7)
MKNSSFVDPTGLSNRNQSTARDLAVLVGAVARNQMLADMSTTRTHLASLGRRTLQYNNSNRLVRNDRPGWDIALQKTGYIVEAGRCLTMLTEVGGQKLIMVLLDADTNGARIADAERMRRWVVAQWGLPDTAVAEAKPVRKVAAKKARDSKADGKRKTVVAKKEAGKKAGKTEVAAAKKTTARKSDGKSAVAAKEGDKKDARVRQTFAASKSGEKS